MFEIYLLVLLPSLAVVFFALKALSGAGIEWQGKQLSPSISIPISVVAIALTVAANCYVLVFLFGPR